MAAGILRYATIGEPPSLDIQMSTATIVATIGQHMFETLYAFDSKYKPQPFLATGEKVEDGGKKLVISLRQDVKFHNGQDMTAEDVVASLKRWGEFGARGSLADEECHLGARRPESTRSRSCCPSRTAPGRTCWPIPRADR